MWRRGVLLAINHVPVHILRDVMPPLAPVPWPWPSPAPALALASPAAKYGVLRTEVSPLDGNPKPYFRTVSSSVTTYSARQPASTQPYVIVICTGWKVREEEVF